MVDNSNFEKLVDLSQKRYSKFYEWLRHILLTASGLIGILVSLHTNKSTTTCEHYSFVITIATLGLGILSGSVLLYSEIHKLDIARKLFVDQLQKILKGDNTGLPIATVETHIIFRISEVICYSSFSLSIISLITYAILNDKI